MTTTESLDTGKDWSTVTHSHHSMERIVRYPTDRVAYFQKRNRTGARSGTTTEIHGSSHVSMVRDETEVRTGCIPSFYAYLNASCVVTVLVPFQQLIQSNRLRGLQPLKVSHPPTLGNKDDQTSFDHV